MFQNYDIINPDSEYLNDSIIKSGEYLEDLEDKIYSYNLDDNNILGKRAMECFKNNLLIVKEVNNYFMQIFF